MGGRGVGSLWLSALARTTAEEGGGRVAGGCDGDTRGGESAWRRGRPSLYSVKPMRTQDEHGRSRSPIPIALRAGHSSHYFSDSEYSLPRSHGRVSRLPADRPLPHTSSSRSPLPPRHRLVVSSTQPPLLTPHLPHRPLSPRLPSPAPRDPAEHLLSPLRLSPTPFRIRHSHPPAPPP